MNTYFLMFRVVPTEKNKYFSRLKGAFAHFWVLEKSPESAQPRAEHHLGQHDWEIETLEQSPVETIPEQFVRTEELSAYRKAQRYGIALVLRAWPRQPGPEDLIEIHQL